MFFLLYPVVMSFKMCLFVFDQSGSKFFKLCTCKLKLVLNAQYLKKKLIRTYKIFEISNKISVYIVYLLSSDPGDLLVTITSGMWSSSSGILAVSSSKFKFRDSSSLSSWTWTCISADTCCWGWWSLEILWFSEWAC